MKIFSRHLEDMTDKYPDIVLLVKQYCHDASTSTTSSKPTSFIVDSEIVAWDTPNECTKSFQELSNRPRKDVALHQVTIPVCLFVFDLMYLSDEVRRILLSRPGYPLIDRLLQPLLATPFRERRRLLHSTFPPTIMPILQGGARLKHVSRIDSDCPGGREDIEAFWEVAVDSQCEGLMVKVSHVSL